MGTRAVGQLDIMLAQARSLLPMNAKAKKARGLACLLEIRRIAPENPAAFALAKVYFLEFASIARQRREWGEEAEARSACEQALSIPFTRAELGRDIQIDGAITAMEEMYGAQRKIAPSVPYTPVVAPPVAPAKTAHSSQAPCMPSAVLAPSDSDQGLSEIAVFCNAYLSMLRRDFPFLNEPLKEGRIKRVGHGDEKRVVRAARRLEQRLQVIRFLRGHSEMKSAGIKHSNRPIFSLITGQEEYRVFGKRAATAFLEARVAAGLEHNPAALERIKTAIREEYEAAVAKE
ncbi:MAG: hypothetical protein NT099_07780 [Candidatus Saganbacteria bacterium]|nr:hypothetical protein [Candidatus Saganbacteria bacterium]